MCEQELGFEDEGCGACLDKSKLGAETDIRQEDSESKNLRLDVHDSIPTSATSAPASNSEASGVNEGPDGPPKRTGKSVDERQNLPPKLEEFLPSDFLPDTLIIIDSDECATGNQGRDKHKSFAQSSVDVDVRRLPVSSTLREGCKNGQESSRQYRYKRILPHSQSSDNSETGHKVATLWLSASRLSGVGHHSSIYRATLQLPEPLVTNDRSKDGMVTVIAKTAFSHENAHDLLSNEGQVLDELSSTEYRYLQCEWCGLNNIRQFGLMPQGFSNPIGMSYGMIPKLPVGAVVPKFYGYYAPIDDDLTLPLSPILLLEDCGEPVRVAMLDNVRRSNT